MSVSPSRSDYLTFVAGLNTEGGYFTQPPNTWKEGDNVVPNIDGSLSRRLCIDYESNHILSSTAYSSAITSTNAYYVGYWRNVGGQAGITYYVVQIGRYLYFYTNEGMTVSLTNTGLFIDLNAYRVSTSTTLGSNKIECTSIEGSLLIVASDINPLFVSLSSGALSVTALTLKIRDFEGLDDGLAANTRPATLSDEHKYNLLNQGWDTTKINAYFAASSVYPANSQAWIYGKNSSGNFDSAVLNQLDFGSSLTPKGRYILNVFSQDRATASGIAAIPTVAYDARPTTCTFFAGRAWYSGIGGSKLGSYLMFSRLGFKPTDYQECYQIADPTSEVLSDLVDTDGGVIPIKDAFNIKAIVPMYDGIVVFAENGVWQVRGTDQGGFSAIGYSLYKLSNIGCVSADSIVQVENTAYYWSNGGIYRLQQDPTTGNVISAPVTDLNIKTLYTAIPSVAKSLSKGTFNNSTKRIVWTYNSTLTNTAEYKYAKSSAIVLDLRLNAFYTWSVDVNTDTTPFITTHFVTDIYAPTNETANVVDSSLDQIVDSLGKLVTTNAVNLATYTEVEKYLTLVSSDSGMTHKFLFSDFETTNDAPAKFRDWYTQDAIGNLFTSYFITGYDISHNGPSNNKYPTYCTVYMKRTETAFDSNGDAVNGSSCLLQTRWAFTDNAIAGKWSDEQEVYRHLRPFIAVPSTDYVDGYPLVITKNKIRGSGKAVQFKFSSYLDYDMQLVGWQAILINMGNV